MLLKYFNNALQLNAVPSGVAELVAKAKAITEPRLKAKQVRCKPPAKSSTERNREKQYKVTINNCFFFIMKDTCE